MHSHFTSREGIPYLVTHFRKSFLLACVKNQDRKFPRVCTLSPSMTWSSTGFTGGDPYPDRRLSPLFPHSWCCFHALGFGVPVPLCLSLSRLRWHSSSLGLTRSNCDMYPALPYTLRGKSTEGYRQKGKCSIPQEHTVSWRPLRRGYMENLGHRLLLEEAVKDGQDLNWAEMGKPSRDERGEWGAKGSLSLAEWLLGASWQSLCPQVGRHDSSGLDLLK